MFACLLASTTAMEEMRVGTEKMHTDADGKPRLDLSMKHVTKQFKVENALEKVEASQQVKPNVNEAAHWFNAVRHHICTRTHTPTAEHSLTIPG